MGVIIICICSIIQSVTEPHIFFYPEVIFLSCGGNFLRKVGSLIMMLSSVYISFFGPPYSGGLTILLFIFLPGNFTNNFGTNCGPACPYIHNLRQSLAIGDCVS